MKYLKLYIYSPRILKDIFFPSIKKNIPTVYTRTKNPNEIFTHFKFNHNKYMMANSFKRWLIKIYDALDNTTIYTLENRNIITNSEFFVTKLEFTNNAPFVTTIQTDYPEQIDFIINNITKTEFIYNPSSEDTLKRFINLTEIYQIFNHFLKCELSEEE